jgi:DNA-binding LytR/AlgR family response regulator
MNRLTNTRIRERRATNASGSTASRKGPLAFFFIRHQGRNVKIRVPEIDFIEARKNYCKIVTKNGAFLTIVTLKRMTEILPPDEFCQIHRTFIVSLHWLRAFDRAGVYGPDQTLPIGEVYRQGLIESVLVIGDEWRKSRDIPD